MATGQMYYRPHHQGVSIISVCIWQVASICSIYQPYGRKISFYHKLNRFFFLHVTDYQTTARTFHESLHKMRSQSLCNGTV